MGTKVFQGTIDRRLDYRIEEVSEGVFTLETKLCLAPIPSGKVMAHSAN